MHRVRALVSHADFSKTATTTDFYVVTLRRGRPRPHEQLLLLNYKTQRRAAFLKDTLTIEDEKLFKAYRSVCSSVPQSHYKSGTPTQSVKISTLYHNFVIHYCRDFSHVLHICTRPLVNYLFFFFFLFKHNIFSDDCPQLYSHEGLSSNLTKIFILYHT